MTTFEDQQYKGVDFNIEGLPKGKYDYCSFQDCQMSDIDLSNYNFVECSFDGCNLSLCKIVGTSFTDLHFKSCKLLGLHFDTLDQFLFSLSFDDCQLDNCVFYQMDLRKVAFVDCRMTEVDFSESDCSKLCFEGCDLSGAVFDQTNLREADFRKAVGYRINPVNNKVKGAKFLKNGLEGLLDTFDIRIT